MDNTGYLIQHVAASLARQSDEMLQTRLGIGYSQYKIMMVLQWHANIRQRQIAELLGQTEASISRQIKKMHDEGLLYTAVRPEDKREHITTLTRKGEQLADEASSLLNRYHVPIFQTLSEQQHQQFAEALDAVHHELCRGDKAGRCKQHYED